MEITPQNLSLLQAMARTQGALEALDAHKEYMSKLYDTAIVHLPDGRKVTISTLVNVFLAAEKMTRETTIGLDVGLVIDWPLFYSELQFVLAEVTSPEGGGS